MENTEEKKSKRQALVITLAVQIVLALLVIFIVAWRAPDPPIPEFGIELNFGTVDAGQGDVQPENTEDVINNEDTSVEDAPTEQSDATEQQTSDEVQEPVEATEETSEPEPVETPDATPVVDNTNESPDVVPEEKPKQTDTEKQQEVKEVKPSSETKKPEEEQPVRNTEKDSEKPANSVNNSEEKNDSPGNGDKNKPGDQGSDEGKIEEKALYGNQGSNDGSMLELAGWKWDDQPNPIDNSQETGKIVFEITVDQDGYITGIKTLEKTVSPTVVQAYRKAVEELTFSKKSDYKPAPYSTGRITFTIKY